MNGDGIGARTAWNKKGIPTENSIVYRRQVDDGHGAIAGENIVGNDDVLIDGGHGGIRACHLVLHIGKLAAEEIGGFSHDIERKKALLMSPAAVKRIVIDDEFLGSRPLPPILASQDIHLLLRLPCKVVVGDPAERGLQQEGAGTGIEEGAIPIT